VGLISGLPWCLLLLKGVIVYREIRRFKLPKQKTFCTLFIIYRKKEEMPGKDLEYWKNNAEENYDQVPISVLRYINELEKFAKKISVKLLENGVYLKKEKK